MRSRKVGCLPEDVDVVAVADDAHAGGVVAIAPRAVTVMPGACARRLLVCVAQRSEVEYRGPALDAADSLRVDPVAAAIDLRASAQRNHIIEVQLATVDEHAGVAT